MHTLSLLASLILLSGTSSASPIPDSKCETPSCTVLVDDALGHFNPAELAELTKQYFPTSDPIQGHVPSNIRTFNGFPDDPKDHYPKPHPPLSLQQQVQKPWDYPWRAIGRFKAKSGKHVCTGTLVGPNLVLTASHCFPVDGECAPNKVEFAAGYNLQHGNLLGAANVTQCRGVAFDRTFETPIAPGYDFTVCKLDSDLGSRVGWMMPWYFEDDEGYYNQTWTAVGYPEEEYHSHVPFVQHGVEITNVTSYGGAKNLESVPYASSGWSGGPLFHVVDKQPRVIGVVSKAESSNGGLEMSRLVSWATANWPPLGTGHYIGR